MTVARLKITGIKELKKALDPKAMNATLQRNLMKANKRIGGITVDHMRQGISNKSFTKNAALTANIKGSSKPLVRDADLFNAISYEVASSKTVFVGVLRTNAEHNIAVIVHQGAEIPVTPAMRSMFFRLWLVSTGQASKDTLEGRAADLYEQYQNWKPLKAGTSVIIVPGRPFAAKSFKSTKLRKRVREIWEQAIAAGLREQST